MGGHPSGWSLNYKKRIMAVSVDRVYQTVLAIANKEQRGYITPQEFNLFANQAQNEIFEQYFYDLNQMLRIPGNKTVSSDARDIIEEKISLFRIREAGFNADLSVINPAVYRLESVRYRNAATQVFYTAEEVTKKEYDMYESAALTRPPANRPIYYRAGSIVYRSPNIEGLYDTTRIDYIRRPSTPNWAYLIVNEAALVNTSAADYNDFELHDSEEKNLVIKILQYAGVSSKSMDVVQVAAQEESKNIQQAKA